MALDFHKLDNNEHLFELDDKTVNDLADNFETFTQWAGLIIDPYGDLKLSIENQHTIITIIEKYVETTDLNKDKVKTSSILEFKGLLKLALNNNWHLKALGD